MRGAKAAILLSLMNLGLTGCGANEGIAPALDLSAIKAPPVRPAVIETLKSRPSPPPVPMTQRASADWIDRLRADIERKAAAGWELVEGVKQCRAPIEKLKTTYSQQLLGK